LNPDIIRYNENLSTTDRQIAGLLSATIEAELPDAEGKVWHAHPVWFLDGNPITGYSRLKDSMRLLFWSGRDFDEPDLVPEGKFKAAEARYTQSDEVNLPDLRRWLTKSRAIQWDYKNIVKRKGVLVRLK
jgi:hypothetical protein